MDFNIKQHNELTDALYQLTDVDYGLTNIL